MYTTRKMTLTMRVVIKPTGLCKTCAIIEQNMDRARDSTHQGIFCPQFLIKGFWFITL